MNWMTCSELQDMLSVSRPTAVKIAREKGWESRYETLPQGGRRKLFAVPEERTETPTEPEIAHDSEEDEQEESVSISVPALRDETIPDLRPKHNEPLHYQEQAHLRAQLCDAILEVLSSADSKTDAWKTIVEAYNDRRFMPELYVVEGHRGERTLRRWVRNYVKAGRDARSLIRKYTVAEATRKATETEQNFLLHLLLNPNRISIGSAIRKLKQMETLQKLESPSSERTLRRWCEEWRDSHKPEWNLLRNGKKSLKETGILSVLRSDDIEVGDVWVADGHKLAFDIIDPATGKPRRMTMIMFFDWASRYPVGASLAVSEDSQHVLLALRNSIMHWGGRPKYVYLDNGKAFRSKLFNKQWEKHDLSKELEGIFPRLGIGVVFAKAYNARAKVVERFFRTFQDDFERYMTTFRGGSIDDKPATLKRNEKWVRNIFAGKPLTIPQAKAMIGLYIEKMYGLTPHTGIGGRKPFEVFHEAAIPAEQQIDLTQLNFLMLAATDRVVQASGVRFSNIHFWHDELIQHIGDKVTIRYDLMDMRSVLVYDAKNRFICQAEARRHQHPFIHLAKDKPQAQKALQKELQSIRRLEKNVQESSEKILLKVNEAVGAIQQPMTDQIGEIFADQPLIEQPEPTLTIDDIVKASVKGENIQLDTKPREDEELNFEELMKAIGIG